MARRPKKYALSVPLPKELYEKIHKLATEEERSASAIVRRLIASLPEPSSVEGA